jgi:hypothetical protein
MTLYQHDRAATFRFEIRGEFCGSLLRELEGCWATALPIFGMRRVIMDVAGVTSWDDDGLALLRRMHAAGAEIEGGALARLIAGQPDADAIHRKPEPVTLLDRVQHWFHPNRPCRERA